MLHGDRHRWAVALMLVLVAAVMHSGCRRSAEIRYEDALAGAPAGAAHPVHDDRLVEVMRGLASLRSQRLPQAIDPADVEARRAREVARVAMAMAESARRIPESAALDLDPANQAVLAELAAELAALCESLAADADQLAADADLLDSDALRARYAEIDATCQRCHGRFGIPWKSDEPHE